MKSYFKSFIFSVFILFSSAAYPQTTGSSKMDWFENSRLGIFVHWGVYSVNGIPESWAFFNNYISYDDYMKQLNGFTAENYDPEKWAKLIKESGAGYAVITSRHHDGVALWDSKMGGLNTRKHAAAKRDLLTPLVTALKKEDLKTGIYYSLPDWSYPDYDVFTKSKKRYDLSSAPGRWAKFQHYFQGQLRELSIRYNPDLYWFDGDWEHSAEEWQTKDVLTMLHGYNKNLIINSRLRGQGDYATPEQGVPVVRPAEKYWELCLTMNDSWGYQQHDKNYKTPNQIIRTFIDCVSNGGNLLLDIGPKPDGTIPDEQAKILKELGRWNRKHAEAVFGTRAGIARNNFQGKTTISVDGKTMYLFVENAPADDVRINGLLTPLKSVKVLGSNRSLNFKTLNETGITHIKIPGEELDPVATVLALHFDEPVKFSNSPPALTNYAALMKRILTEPLGTSENQFIYALTQDLALGYNPFLQGHIPALSNPSNMERKVLKSLDRWTLKNAEILEKTVKGLPYGYYNGLSTLSADRQTLYLFVEGKPTGPIAIKGIKNKIQRVRIVGNGTLLTHQIMNKQYWSDIPGLLYIDIPPDQLDPAVTVIAVLLDKPIDHFADEVKAIETN